MARNLCVVPGLRDRRPRKYASIRFTVTPHTELARSLNNFDVKHEKKNCAHFYNVNNCVIRTRERERERILKIRRPHSISGIILKIFSAIYMENIFLVLSQSATHVFRERY